jgi:predicted Zn-dependent protease with MMP-like domain
MDGSVSDAEFAAWADEALASVPAELRDAMSNVAIVVEDEPPPGQPLLGLYEGVPLTRRTSSYGAVPPDKISIYRGPLERLYGDDPDRLREQVRRVVLHEVAHHFRPGRHARGRRATARRAPHEAARSSLARSALRAG